MNVSSTVTIRDRQYTLRYSLTMVLACKSQGVLERIIEKLRSAFDITLSDCSSFAGLQLIRDRLEKSMFLHQSAYTQRILEKICMSKAKAVSVPANPHVMLETVELREQELCNTPYCETVRSLMFLVTVSRSDIILCVQHS